MPTIQMVPLVLRNQQRKGEKCMFPAPDHQKFRHQDMSPIAKVEVLFFGMALRPRFCQLEQVFLIFQELEHKCLSLGLGGYHFQRAPARFPAMGQQS
jgi:hypothetical protein